MSQLNISGLSGIPSTLNQVTVPTGHTLRISGALDLDFTGAYRLPNGTTAQRPTSPTIGSFRFNTDINAFEIYSGGGVWSSISEGSAGTSIGSFQFPAANGMEIRDAGQPSGYYWIKPVGYDAARYCYVDNTNYDGGWVLVLTVGSGTATHYTQYEANNLYTETIDGQSVSYVPFDGPGYSSGSGRRWEDTFIRDVASQDNGGEEVFSIRVAQNGAQPPGGPYDTYAGGTTADWRYSSFTRFNRGIQYFSSLNTGGDGRQGDRREGTFSVSHSYPYNWERPGGYDHMRVYNGDYKVWDYHSNPSSLQTSRYGVNRVLWGYQSRNGIYGGSSSFTGSSHGNPGYLFVR